MGRDYSSSTKFKYNIGANVASSYGEIFSYETRYMHTSIKCDGKDILTDKPLSEFGKLYASAHKPTGKF